MVDFVDLQLHVLVTLLGHGLYGEVAHQLCGVLGAGRVLLTPLDVLLLLALGSDLQVVLLLLRLLPLFLLVDRQQYPILNQRCEHV